MNIHARSISTVLFALCMTLSTAASAQTPVQKRPPNLTIRWLSSMTVSPAVANAGTKLIGTVKLERPAVSNLRVDLGLIGATAVEGAGFVLDGVIVPQSVTVPAGRDQATFTIMTSGTASTRIGSKKFTATASYSSESLSADFTVNRIAYR
ncbi:MAG: hypothetical protein Q8L49_01640 [Burkholderiaceae bacterium]|nr:hypothetical protein [Burkholderiaceae bacterium]